ncbi:MgtC/SapB family protein [Tropicimonas sp. IMCC34043]|uniref:MgtC/SapB family protein n=1 Tax=Tropicimonas sp. IMCC34043 TaxID=2248760 RepID=UPI000E256E65|nr:MgtC/SapB family protein [Tropicimonas sp. IMCC34043]
MQQILDLLSAELAGSFAGTDWRVATLRLVMASLMGAVIGFEREVTGKPAGMRTHILVALAACLFALIAQHITVTMSATGPDMRFDPLRLVAAITNGVAFLGAGTIIVALHRVKGLTTAAGMWLAGAVGLATGIGSLGLALIATALAVVILGPLKWLERPPHDK